VFRPVVAVSTLAATLAFGSLAQASPPDDIVRDGRVLPRARLEASLTYEVDVSKRAAGEPWSLAPDLSYGVTDELTLGLVHSARALSLIDSGQGVCFSGHDCRGIYDDVTIDSRYALLSRDGFTLAARLRFANHAFSPWKPSLRPGLYARWTHGRFAITTDPQVQVGLANRERGNRDWVRWPLWFGFQPARHVMLALRTGVEGEWVTLRDSYLVSAGLDLTVRVRWDLDASLSLGFPAALGPLNDGFERHLGVTVTGRWW
jgi:hypothetical protein